MARLHPKLRQHRGDVVAHGLLGDEKPSRDLHVGRPLAEVNEDFLLAAGQPELVGPGLRPRTPRDRLETEATHRCNAPRTRLLLHPAGQRYVRLRAGRPRRRSRALPAPRRTVIQAGATARRRRPSRPRAAARTARRSVAARRRLPRGGAARPPASLASTSRIVAPGRPLLELPRSPAACRRPARPSRPD